MAAAQHALSGPRPKKAGGRGPPGKRPAQSAGQLLSPKGQLRPPLAPAFSFSFSSGLSATVASVVRRSPATEAAF